MCVKLLRWVIKLRKPREWGWMVMVIPCGGEGTGDRGQGDTVVGLASLGWGD